MPRVLSGIFYFTLTEVDSIRISLLINCPSPMLYGNEFYIVSEDMTSENQKNFWISIYILFLVRLMRHKCW